MQVEILSVAFGLICCTPATSIITTSKSQAKHFAGKYLPVGVQYTNVTSRSLLHCTQHCTTIEGCLSLIYEAGTGWCGMLNDIFSFPEEVEFTNKSRGSFTFVEVEKVHFGFFFYISVFENVELYWVGSVCKSATP